MEHRLGSTLTFENASDYIYCGDFNLNPTYKERFANTRELIISSQSYEIPNISWDQITDIDQDSIKASLAVEAGQLIWFAKDENEQEARWCRELGIQVFVVGKGLTDENGDFIVGSSGEYGNTVGGGTEAIPSGVYCCAPDLKNSFNTGNTYYLVYENGVNKEPTVGDEIYKDCPSGWYDYGEKKWANIVTASNGRLAYFTWIPRYMVKYDTEGNVAKKDGQLDLCFVDLNNNYKSSTESKTGEQMRLEGYVVPDSFEFGGQKLSGIWVGKYEMSNPREAIGFLATSTEDSITINSLTVVGESRPEEDSGIKDVTERNVVVEIDGKKAEGTLPLKIEGLSRNTTYNVKVTIETGKLDNLVLSKNIRTLEGSIKEITAPDLSGFNKNNTYFVDFSSSENGVIGSNIKKVQDDLVSSRQIADPAVEPENWYDYGEKKWANIVTMKDTGEAAYFTWVPRYEYKIDETLRSVDIIYITANKTTPDEGYTIPDSFKFGGQQLSGIWVGKYEVSDVAIPTGFTTALVDGGFKITGITYSGDNLKKSGMPNSGSMTIVGKDGTSYNSTMTAKVGQTIKLAPGTYEVTWSLPYSYNENRLKEVKQEVVVKTSSKPNSPDLSGFNKDSSYVYYVLFDGNATSESSMKIGDRVIFGEDGNPTNIPKGWYDYENKKWANIIVSNEELTPNTVINYNGLYGKKNITMWVWIPKYEYKIDDTGRTVSTIFISGNSVDSGYTIPDCFKFDGKELSGIWVGKYEVSDQ